MLARIDLRGAALPGVRDLAGLLPRAATDIDSVLATVRPLCEDVRIRGAQAVREITARLDGVELQTVDLLETLAQRLADVCLADPRVDAAVVIVHKPQAPIPLSFGDVSVEIRRERS